MRSFFNGFLFGFICACVLLGLLVVIGCSSNHDKDTLRTKDGCIVQFWSDLTGRLEKTQCKYGVASTKVPTPLYEGGPMVTWCVCKPWLSSDPTDAHAPLATSPGSSHRAR